MKFLSFKAHVKVYESRKLYSYKIRKYFNKVINQKKDEICPYCASRYVIKYGYFADNKQRYRCKSCKKTFNADTNSVLSYTKKKIENWLVYINCMEDKLSIRKSAVLTKVSIKTAFYWRHKILKVLNEKPVKNMKGIVEIKTAYIKESFKGKRYPDCYRRDLELGKLTNEYNTIVDRRVCVICCKDRNGNLFSKTLCRGSINYKNVETALKDKIHKNSEICTDNNMAYESFARRHGVKLYKIKYMNQVVNDKYHIKNATRIASDLEDLVSMCRGVCTRYLNFYTAWIRWLENKRNDNKMKTLRLMRVSKIRFRNRDMNMVGELG